ncbi:MAG TPA: Uma2 family endonuclease [Dehalococcoidia bacterium]|nr:Uma2 family endonuclease [Dehalococcoidia bacterium]
MVARTIEPPAASPATLERPRRRFSADDYDRIIAAGIFEEDEPVELCDGEVVYMAPIGAAYSASVDRGNAFFTPRTAGKAIVRVQSSFRLNDWWQPEPDLLLLRYRDDFYHEALPRVEDVLLLIEVADSSLLCDRERKIPQYGKDGIGESWLVDLANERLLVYRTPLDGRYSETRSLGRGAPIAPLAFPELTLTLDDLIGPKA